MKKDYEEEKHPVTYYGKKVYQINPLLVRKKSTKEKTPDYGTEECSSIVKANVKD